MFPDIVLMMSVNTEQTIMHGNTSCQSVSPLLAGPGLTACTGQI